MEMGSIGFGLIEVRRGRLLDMGVAPHPLILTERRNLEGELLGKGQINLFVTLFLNKICLYCSTQCRLKKRKELVMGSDLEEGEEQQEKKKASFWPCGPLRPLSFRSVNPSALLQR